MAIGFTSLLTASLCLLANAVQAQERAGAAPLPDAARGPAIPQDKGYLVEELGEGLYWITEGMYQTFFLTTGEGVVVVDAPPSLAQHILKAVSEVTDEPITHLVYSHSHADHIDGAGAFPEGLTVIAHEETAERLRKYIGHNNANHLALVAAMASLDDKGFVRRSLETNDQARRIVHRCLNDVGLSIYPATRTS